MNLDTLNLDWLLQPLTIYAAVGLGLTACAAIFLSTKREVWRLRRTAKESSEAFTRKLDEMQSAIAEISKPPAIAEEAAPAPAPAIRPSVNLTRRAQALRMRRRGESVESISA
ncbi:MAG TPA: hypothetical protein VJ732_12920, partial [Bryobacteraceae bacterium]|nr:hypothetical protein [Bryobacteraceae bacterium]